VTSARLKYVTLGLGALLIMFFLYINTQSVDLDKHQQLLDRISRFMWVDATLNQHILEIREGLLPFYDPTVDDMAELKQLRSEMEGNLRTHLCLENFALILEQIIAVDQALSEKQELLEAFKSSNAILRNSLRYLPVITSQIIARLPTDGQGVALRQTLNILLLDMLIYNTNSDAELGVALSIKIAALKRDSSQHVFSVSEDLGIFLTHAGIVLENKKRADLLVQKLVNFPTAGRMEKLLTAYVADHNRMMQKINIYRQMLYGFSVLLLACIGYILFRLNHTAVKLQRTVADLKYQKFAMDQHAIVSITDRSGNITYANQKFCDINQRTAEELIGQNHRLAKSDYHPASFFKDLWRTITCGKVWHGQIQNKARDGSRYWADTTIVPFIDDEGVPYQYVAIRTDITEIKQAEEQLRVQAAALEVAANGIIITDREGNIQWVNAAFTTITGYSREEAIGQTPRLLKSDQQDAAFYQNMWKTVLSGHVWHGEMMNRRKGGVLYSEEQTISPVYDEQGEISHFISIKQDISERQQTEQALRRSQKMEAIGQLSGGIAHDFNNQLGIVIGYLDFLKDYVSENIVDDKKPHWWVDTATKATLRCTALTRQLLAFSRRQAEEKTTVDLNVVVRELETMIARSVTPEVEVQYFLTVDLWLTEIDPGEFQDAVLNLVINARDAMPDGGKLLIETNNTHLDADYVALNPGIKPGDYVQLMISDTGIGMDKETLERVFEPFFTTKPAGKGTGLGMAMVYGFIKRYGGHIKVYSETGVGTTMRLYLPRSSDSVANVIIPMSQSSRLPTGTETILIVDDEIDLLQLADQYLTELGYHTLHATSAAQALNILAQDEVIDLLFSDVVMPGGMSGYELALQATQLANVQKKPSLKVLLTSGFTSKTMMHNDLARFSAHMLSKPYRKDDLAHRIRRVLDGG